MSLVVVDTDVASRVRKGTLPAPLVRRLAGQTLCVTFVTVGELTAWSFGSQWGPGRQKAFAQWVDGFRILPYGAEVARVWGRLTAAARQRGRTSPVNDTWLAAACIDAGLPLATLNVRDFAQHAAHGGLRLIGA